jgi:hypothetical protein
LFSEIQTKDYIKKIFVLFFFTRLRDVILTDARLYLIFEYLAMDLKKYLDCLGENEEMDAALIRVRIENIQNFYNI